MTNPNTTAANLIETWDTTRHRVESRVELVNAPDIQANGNTYSPYTISFVFRRTADSAWASEVVIYCQPYLPGGAKSLRSGYLHPKQLSEIPGWLADIIARATPSGS